MNTQPDPAAVGRYFDETAPQIGLRILAECRDGVARKPDDPAGRGLPAG